MTRTFYKYQATGNDFVMIDNRAGGFPKEDTDYIRKLCDRRFGVGADGLILLENEPGYDFRMVYYNADGREGSMCGNGGRCIAAFARNLGLVSDSCSFLAVDGPHEARLEGPTVWLKMGDVAEVHRKPRYVYLDTGSPHHVQEVAELEDFDVQAQGRRLRYSLYGEPGSNINFVRPLEGNRFRVRTYERGVEDETYSCGTGVTAVALAMSATGKLKGEEAGIETRGGELSVRFRKSGNGSYSDIWLAGPAEQVFKGTLA